MTLFKLYIKNRGADEQIGHSPGVGGGVAELAMFGGVMRNNICVQSHDSYFRMVDGDLISCVA